MDGNARRLPFRASVAVSPRVSKFTILGHIIYSFPSYLDLRTVFVFKLEALS